MIVNGVVVESIEHLNNLVKDMPENVKSFLISVYTSKYNS